MLGGAAPTAKIMVKAQLNGAGKDGGAGEGGRGADIANISVFFGGSVKRVLSCRVGQNKRWTRWCGQRMLIQKEFHVCRGPSPFAPPSCRGAGGSTSDEEMA
jgi:hypothetical protein